MMGRDKVNVTYSREQRHEAIAQNRLLRRHIYNQLVRRKHDGILPTKPRPLLEGQVPTAYLAGGMVPSIPSHTDFFIRHENFQHRIIQGTGGHIGAETTTGLRGNYYEEPGNFVPENPMRNGESTKERFVIEDYARILVSHASINYVQAGHNRRGNPGFAQLAEIAAQWTRGGLNVVVNEKGYSSEHKPGWFDPQVALFDDFATPGHHYDSLDEAIEFMNQPEAVREALHLAAADYAGRTEKLKAWRDERRASDGSRNPVLFIGLSQQQGIAQYIADRLPQMGVGEEDVIWGRDEVNPFEDARAYAELVRQGDFILIVDEATHNRIVPRHAQFIESAVGVMHGIPVTAVSQNYELQEAADELATIRYQSLTARGVVDIAKKVRDFQAEDLWFLRDQFNDARFNGPDFIGPAPGTDVYRMPQINGALMNLRKDLRYFEDRQ